MWCCKSCGSTTNTSLKRLPAGWKRERGTGVLCRDCWRGRYVLRAVAIPIVRPLDCTWKTLRDALNTMWAATTGAANWMMTELYTRDVRRQDGVGMPPHRYVYLYPEARARFPMLPPKSVAALEHTVQKKYRALRYKVLWTFGATLPTHRYPVPFSVPGQAWRAAIVDRSCVVSLPIGDRRVHLRLKGGPRFFRQNQAVRQIVDGKAVPGELSIYARGDCLMCKIVAWLPRPAVPSARFGSLLLRTDARSLLVAEDNGGNLIWRYHADHVPRWIAGHRRRLQRWADDGKFEAGRHVPFEERRDQECIRYGNRLDSACHQAAAYVSGYARRRRFELVHYHDGERGFCPQFPWARLRDLLREGLDAAGIGFELAAAGVEAAAEETEVDWKGLESGATDAPSVITARHA